MKNKKLVISVLILSLSNVFCSSSFAKSNSSLASQAAKEVKQGQVEFALMRYRNILRNEPKSKYANIALFALGEYFFMHSNYKHANDYFQRYIDAQKSPNQKLFALAYLLKIAQVKSDTTLIQNLEQQIKSLYPQSFVFRKVKEYSYKSPLSRKHKAVYSIDQINIFIEDISIAKIKY